MQREKRIGFCGKPCSLCSVSKCPGCRVDGDIDHSRCENYRCVKNRELTYCHQCVDFPCSKGALTEVVPLGVSKFLQIFTEEETLDYLARNERNGMLYHYLYTLRGDYDRAETPDDVMEMILKGSDENLLN